jgi:hypothetical protein
MNMIFNRSYHYGGNVLIGQKAPSTKHQAPGKFQAPSFNCARSLTWCLGFGASLGFGYLCLELRVNEP